MLCIKLRWAWWARRTENFENKQCQWLFALPYGTSKNRSEQLTINPGASINPLIQKKQKHPTEIFI